MKTYLVKSKTGKMITCDSKEEAMELAKNMSTKKKVFNVYEDGKSIAAFINKKKLLETITLGVWYTKPMSEEIKQRTFEHYNGEKNFVASDTPYMYTLLKAKDRIRIKITNKVLVLTKDKKHICRFKSQSVTFTQNGRVFWYNGKLHFDAAPYVRIPEHAMKMLCHEIGKMRPELASVMKLIMNDNDFTDLHDIAMVFIRPTRYYIVDAYKRIAKKRSFFWWILETKFPRGVITEDKLVEILAKGENVPFGKQLKKLYMLDLRNIQVVKALIYCGIIDVNYIVRLSDLGIALYGLDPCMGVFRFVTRVFEIRGTQSAVHFFEHSHSEQGRLVDCSRMANNVSEEVVKYIIKNAKDLDEIHDTLVEQTRNNRMRRNIVFEYTDKEINRFNRTYGNVKFELGIDSKDLAVVGATMGICVGSYAEAVAYKQTTIVKMTDNNKYAACIEVRGNRMIQLKAKCNNPVKAQYKNVIDKWLEDSGLTPDTADYENIGKEWNNTYNYAMVNPHDYDERHETLRIVKFTNSASEPMKKWFRLQEYLNECALEEFRAKRKAEDEEWYANVAARYAMA